MSYDINLTHPVSGETLEFLNKHDMQGGTYQLGGTKEAHLNVTYNYGEIFRRVMGDEGIRTIYGKTGEESIPILESAIAKLSDDVSDDYWEATDGNAKTSLMILLYFAQRFPIGIWDGD